MLEFLRIRNLALIQDMELEFSPGLNVLTGESGAGKSFILRALDFILGDKLRPDMVRPGQEKAQVEALFALPEGDMALRRELMAESGRSRLSINDSLSSQDKIRELRSRLVIHTSQHAQQRLLKPATHTQIVDSAVDMPIKQDWSEALSEFRQLSREKDELQDKTRQLAEKRDFLEYQKAEIDKVDPREGEMDELESRKQLLQDQAKNMEGMQRCLDLLHGEGSQVLNSVRDLQREAARLGESDPEITPFADQLEDFRHLLSDFDLALRQKPLPHESDTELESIESRLWELSQLQRKMNKPFSAILSMHREIEDNLSFLDQCQLDLQQLERRIGQVREQLEQASRKLTRARRDAAASLQQRLETGLKNLGFSDQVQVVFEFTSQEVVPGIFEERPRLMWVPNPGQSPQPLDQIASGGELSRFLLALVGLMAEEDLPTLIFDEVDAGIGGMILGQVGRRIQELAEKQQVLLISHWPQLACLADRHFQVKKMVQNNETFTQCMRLSSPEIFAELARMAGGGEQGQVLAQQLLEGQPS